VLQTARRESDHNCHQEYAGDLMGDMNGRRSRITGMDTKGTMQIIRALVPMAEMLS
jgi:elongation factor G